MVYVNLRWALIVAVLLAFGIAYWWHHRTPVMIVPVARPVAVETAEPPVGPPTVVQEGILPPPRVIPAAR